MICCILNWLSDCRCCNRNYNRTPFSPVADARSMGSLNFIPSAIPAPARELRTVQANLSTGAGSTIASGDAITFDSLIANQNKFVRFDYATNEFVINKIGNFLLSWWIGVAQADGLPCVSAYQNGGSIATACMPSTNGQLYGSTAITVAHTPARISIVNSSPFGITLSNGDVQASMVLTQIF